MFSAWLPQWQSVRINYFGILYTMIEYETQDLSQFSSNVRHETKLYLQTTCQRKVSLVNDQLILDGSAWWCNSFVLFELGASRSNPTSFLRSV